MNWGTKLVLGMVVFVLFIMSMVAYMFIRHDKDALVEENYYEKGLSYDKQYNDKQNVSTNHSTPIISIQAQQIIIQLKEEAQYTLKLLRPSDSKADQHFKGQTVGSSHLIVIPRTKTMQGLWSLSLQWESNHQNYLYQKDIFL